MFHRANIFGCALKSISAHDGRGEVLSHRLLSSDECMSACNFIDFTVMPVGTTIGLHTHQEHEEEYYLILSGEGRMTCDGYSFHVKAGDLIRNPPAGTHGLENTGTNPLELFVFEIKVLP